MKYYDPKISTFLLCGDRNLNSLRKTALVFPLSVTKRLTYANLQYARDFNIFRLYDPSLQFKLNEIINNDFDLVYADHWACSYLYGLKLQNRLMIPVILEFFSPTLYSQRQLSKFGSSADRIRALLCYLSYRLFEVNRYKLFEAGIYVCRTHLELSKPFVPKNSFIIPPGVDLEYFKPLEKGLDEVPSILFLGSMHYPSNLFSVLYFYKKIYPTIKEKVPGLKFYIVGRHPPKKIKELTSYPSVVVTGFVDDVRPYFSIADVFVNPIVVDDGGIKSKVLEAMAMGKAVVSTPLGVRDIGVTDNENVIIAKNDREFAEKTLELLRNESERKRIGINARKFVEENYSWEKQSKALYNVFRELINGG